MHHFEYKGDELFCEDVPVSRIASETGTPVYIYSSATLTKHFKVFDLSFKAVPHLVCYSMKANSNGAILNLFSTMGGGADIVSGGELYRALKAGIDPGKIVYSGVGKTSNEIDMALDAGILMFNVESEQELEKINQRAKNLGVCAPVALRVNPDVDPKTHPYISTGLKKNKFGINIEKSLKYYIHAQSMPNINIIGLDFHIGSQLTTLSPFIDALKKIKGLIQQLQNNGINIQYLDIGGGLGITYDQEKPPHPDEYARIIVEQMKDMNLKLIFEPGRVIVGNAGILVASVIYTKEGDTKDFLIVDAAMNDLMRPSLYDAYHNIIPVIKNDRSIKKVDIVGPICESGDFLAKDRQFNSAVQGDLIAVMSAGAYGFTMSSNYNSRTRAAEVMVKGDRYHIIRQRDVYEDMIKGESLPDWQ